MKKSKKIEKYSQKNVRIVYTYLCVCVCVCVCACVCIYVGYICVLLCVDLKVIFSMCVYEGKFEVVSWLYEMRCVAKVKTDCQTSFHAIRYI